jgi:pseudaminic acid cytidylyltransferase
MKKKRLAVVPARGGSKRIPGKNIRSFCGKPMIIHILEAARESNLFDKIHVSTENSEIHRVSAAAGFAPDFMRPENLSDDQTGIMPVLKFVADKYSTLGKNFDEIWLLMACAPLIEATDLVQASSIMDQGNKGMALLAVSEYPAPIEWAFTMDDKSNLVPLQPGMFAHRSQDLQKRYFDSGTFIAFPESRIIASEGSGNDSGFNGYVLPREKSIDIDTEADWRFAESLYKARLKDE